jgi:hypothetical protein
LADHFDVRSIVDEADQKRKAAELGKNLIDEIKKESSADLNEIQRLLKDPNLDINWKDADHFTAPMWSIASQNREVIKAIFSVPGIDWTLKIREHTIFDCTDHFGFGKITDAVAIKAGITPVRTINKQKGTN